MKKIAYTLTIILIVLASCNNSDKTANYEGEVEKKKIKQLFLNWKRQQIKEGNFLPSEKCTPDWVAKHESNDTSADIILGFPSDSAEYNFSFSDLNNDGKLDGLITFTPNQCDGGNASMWIQWTVFFLSDKDNYIITDTLQVDKFVSTEFDSLGFYWLDSIATNKIFGTYIEFKDGDGHCCPSINRPVIFDFTKRKLIFIGENMNRK